MENENEDEKENESEDRKMTYEMMENELNRCPRCGSTNCADYDSPYWIKCLDCGFESMASEDPNKAIEYWVNGYADIEDKAKHVGINGLDHDELVDLWWYEVGMDGCVDMGMQPEEVDQYWDEHPQDLKENMELIWDHLGIQLRSRLESFWNIWGW